MEKINLNSLAGSQISTCLTDDFALIEDVEGIQQMDVASVRLEGYMMTLVLEGSGEIEVEGSKILINSGDIICSTPDAIFHPSLREAGTKVRGLFVTTSYVERIKQATGFGWNINQLSTYHAVLHCSEKETAMFVHFLDIIKEIVAADNHMNRKKTCACIMVGLGYMLQDIIANQGIYTRTINYTSAEYIFQKFSDYIKSDEVGYVSVDQCAAHLNISPKYFSALCKKHFGRTASAVINEMIVWKIKKQLRETRLSVKEVSVNLGFLNQSHFACYFRRHVGMTPQQFRASLQKP